MDEFEITTEDLMSNEYPGAPAANPWECHDYRHTIEYETNDGYCGGLVWSLSGDVPVGIEITQDGVIEGKIRPFKEQPSCLDVYDDGKPMAVDGENWKEAIKLYKQATYTFNFTVIATFRVTDNSSFLDEEYVGPDPEPYQCDITKEQVVTSNVSIMVIRNNNLTNYLYLRAYLEAGYYIVVGSTKYYLNKTTDLKDEIIMVGDGFSELIAVHPGPFSVCTG